MSGESVGSEGHDELGVNQDVTDNAAPNQPRAEPDVLAHWQEKRSYSSTRSWNLPFAGMIELMQVEST
eukprot:5365681-Karenia_brevis.AAC.1